MPKHIYTIVTVFVVLTCLLSLTNITSVHEQCPYTKLTMSVNGSEKLPEEVDTEKRMCTLKEKATQNYEARKSEYKLKIQNEWDKVAQFLNDNVEIPETTNSEGLNKLGVSLHRLLTVYEAVRQEHIA